MYQCETRELRRRRIGKELDEVGVVGGRQYRCGTYYSSTSLGERMERSNRGDNKIRLHRNWGGRRY